MLADENVERKAARYLEKRGHDVEMVVDALGAGTDDDAIIEHAIETDRLVLSGDDDFLSEGYPTLFHEDGEMAVGVAQIVDEVAAAMSQDDLEDTGGTKLVKDWL